MLTLTASGSVSDYEYSDTSTLRQSVATTAGVDMSLITIGVAAASVIITATISIPASTTATTVQTSLASALGTAVAASTRLGITVEEVPTVTVASLPPPPPPGLPLPPPQAASGLDTGVIAALVVGLLVAVGCASVALYLGCIRGKRPKLPASVVDDVVPPRARIDYKV